MDAVDLFRKLGAGAKFDLKRFGKDAERFKILRSQGGQVESDQTLGIDYFGAGSTGRTQIRAEQQKEVCSQKKKKSESQEEESDVGDERKRRLEERPVATKRKRRGLQEGREVGEPQGSTEGSGISWTSSSDSKVSNQPKAGKENASLKRLKDLHHEKVNRVRGQHRIYVHGSDIPDPVCTFEDLQSEYGLNPRLLQNLREAGLAVPTAIQMQAIPLMMHQREILACAPTGSGKTLAFCLPLLSHLKQPANMGFRAVVISPTRELASQTHRELCRLSEGLGFRVHIIDKASLAAKKYGPQSSKKYDILVSTPNRLVYLLKEDPPALDLSRVEWLVVDESDKLFEDGKTGFREQLATVFLACTCPAVRRALFSATCTPDVEQWCRLNLDNLVSVTVGQRNTAVDTVDQDLLFVGTENGKLLAVRDLIKKGFLPPMLVFVQSIERAQELFHELVYEGINVDVIHAERTQQQRDNVVKSFRSGDIWVLICTALLARGIDFKGVNLVLNYDFPTSAVDYIHRIGRTGRAGHKGRAVTFFTENDKPLLRSIANVIKQAGCPVPDYMMGFKKIHSKLKRKLQQRPPRRTTISTTPRSFAKGNAAGPARGKKARGTQNGVQTQSKGGEVEGRAKGPRQRRTQKPGGKGQQRHAKNSQKKNVKRNKVQAEERKAS